MYSLMQGEYNFEEYDNLLLFLNRCLINTFQIRNLRYIKGIVIKLNLLNMRQISQDQLMEICLFTKIHTFCQHDEFWSSSCLITGG